MGTVNMIIMILLVVIVLWTVMTRSLLKAAIGLALASAVLTIIMFRLDAPIAAVYELSVCAGLIPVIFITVSSLTKPLTKEEVKKESKEKITRFWPLPIIFIVMGAYMALQNIRLNIKTPSAAVMNDVKIMVWSVRQIDLIGQMAVLLAGAFAILILFKEMRPK